MTCDSSHSDGLKLQDTDVEKAGFQSFRCILMFPSAHLLYDVSVASSKCATYVSDVTTVTSDTECPRFKMAAPI